MKTWLSCFTLALLTLLLAASISWAATGFVEITSHDIDQPLCVENSLVVFGEFMLATDDTPRGRADASSYCNPGHYWALYSPQCCSDPINYTNIHARLRYQINEDASRLIRNVTSYYVGGSGYSQVGVLQNFSVRINRSDFSPGQHSLTVFLQDIFGVHCQYWWTSYTYYGLRVGEVLDQKTITFNIPGPEDERCCDLEIQNFNGGGSVNVGAGQVAELTATVAGSPGQEIQWEIALLAGDSTLPDPGIIAAGTNREIAVHWNGRAADGTLVEPGNYTVVLTARLAASPGCASEESTTVRADWDADCDLNINFGSRANIASGNLAYSQPLYALSGSGPAAELTIHYNSLDPFAGILGRGWSHSYELLLRELADGSVLLKKGNGERRLYVPTGDGYRPPPGDYSLLSQNSDQTFTLRLKNGTAQQFNAAGKLAAIIDRNGNTLSLHYQDGLLISITDPAGRVSELTYDDHGRLATVIDPAGRTYNFTMVDNRLQSVSLPDGNEWRYTYDEQGILTARTDLGGFTTRYQYDEQRRVTTATDPEGRERSIAYPPPSPTVAQSVVVTEKDGSQWHYTYDNQRGNLIAKEDPQGGISQYRYDEYQNLLSHTDPDGNTTTYTYDERGNPLTLTDPLEQITRYSYNQYGQVAGITDPAGDFTEYRYDEQGNLAAIIDPTGAKTSFEADARGNITGVTDPTGSVTTMTYDAAGNLITVTDPAGATTRFEYDAAGRLVKQIDPRDEAVSYKYDSRDNLIRVTDPLGNRTSFTYDANGNLLSLTDANGNTTRYNYNSRGQMVEMIDAEGSATTFSYGGGENCYSCAGPGADRLTALTDAKNQITTFAYDPLGRITAERDPLGHTTSYLRDAGGKVISRTDPNGHTINYRYDKLGRLIEKSYPDDSSATFTYNRKGLLQTAANRHISYSFSYDPAGRITMVTDSEGRVIAYEYDQSGRRTAMTTPDGRTVNYRYNAAGQLAAIAAGEEFTFGYDELGRRTKLDYPNGLTARYHYDAAGRLTALQHHNPADELISQSLYTLDQIGNRLSKTTEHLTVAYDYDRIYRLEEAVQSTPGASPAKERGNSGNGREQARQQQKEYYRYDPAGNRLASHLHRDYSHNTANQLLSTAKVQYSYDNNGNLAKKEPAEGITSYHWDYENHLVAVILPDGIKVEFAYDPFGRRIEKKTTSPQGVNITRYVYDHQDIILELDGSGTIGNRYLHGPGVDEPLALNQGGRTYYYHADGLGSIAALTDERGRVVQDYQYDSYGNLHDRQNRVKQPYTYTGREYDRETGLYYYRARYYDAQIGRFITKDPIGFAGGDINLYRYVTNNPINWVDPWGLTRTFLIKQFVDKTVKSISNSYMQDIDPAGRRIISAGLGGAAAGAVGGAIVGTPALGIGAGPSAIIGGVSGFSGGLLIQTGLEAVGLGHAIEDLINEIFDNYLDSVVNALDYSKLQCR
jgi:RHS repeat-associated protein